MHYAHLPLNRIQASRLLKHPFRLDESRSFPQHKREDCQKGSWQSSWIGDSSSGRPLLLTNNLNRACPHRCDGVSVDACACVGMVGNLSHSTRWSHPTVLGFPTPSLAAHYYRCWMLGKLADKVWSAQRT